jgi:hypothetical protein
MPFSKCLIGLRGGDDRLMYICNICGTEFDEPVSGTCPVCANTDYDAADSCQCGRLKPKRDALCMDCKERLTNRLCDFLDTLTYEEEEQTDRLLDGNSVHDHNDWRRH